MSSTSVSGEMVTQISPAAHFADPPSREFGPKQTIFNIAKITASV
jgi:hypothetical protein